MPRPKNYASNVFINCPFDDGYRTLFEAIVFAVIDCGFIPRCALEDDDSGAVRIEKIMNIIAVCQYGVHDISMVKIDKNTGLPRFNMPYELGLFIGCKRFGTGRHDEKRCLILDTERYRYRDFLSDIAGQDIRGHNNKPDSAIRAVRDFLASSSGRITLPGAPTIISRYKRFLKEKPAGIKALKWDAKQLSFLEIQHLTKVWLEVNAV